MTRAKAIAKFCLDCAGSPKEVTLCDTFDCPLWPYRFGKVNMGTKEFSERMERIKTSYPKEFESMKKKYLEHKYNIQNEKILAHIVPFFEANSRRPIHNHSSGQNSS